MGHSVLAAENTLRLLSLGEMLFLQFLLPLSITLSLCFCLCYMLQSMRYCRDCQILYGSHSIPAVARGRDYCLNYSRSRINYFLLRTILLHFPVRKVAPLWYNTDYNRGILQIIKKTQTSNKCQDAVLK